MTKTEKLIINYEAICNEIVEVFSKKQGLEFGGWVGDQVGGVAEFISQYYFSIDDLILDLKTNQKKWFIMQWQDDCMNFNNDPFVDGKHINYKSYINGLRYHNL